MRLSFGFPSFSGVHDTAARGVQGLNFDSDERSHRSEDVPYTKAIPMDC